MCSGFPLKSNTPANTKIEKKTVWEPLELNTKGKVEDRFVKTFRLFRICSHLNVLTLSPHFNVDPKRLVHPTIDFASPILGSSIKHSLT